MASRSMDMPKEAGRVVRLVFLYRRRIPLDQWDRTRVSMNRVQCMYAAEPSRYIAAIALAQVICRRFAIPTTAIAAAAYVMLAAGSDQTRVNEYLSGVAAGDRLETDGDPRIAIFRIFANQRSQRLPYVDYRIMAYLLKGWNLYVRRALAPVVHWSEMDGIPKVINANNH